MTTDAAATAHPTGVPIILTADEVARAARRSTRHIERAVAAGLLRRIGPGRYRAADVTEWIDAGMPSGREPRGEAARRAAALTRKRPSPTT
jgi:hypothetical protein